MLRWYSKIAKNRGYNDSKTISLLFLLTYTSAWPCRFAAGKKSQVYTKLICCACRKHTFYNNPKLNWVTRPGINTGPIIGCSSCGLSLRDSQWAFELGNFLLGLWQLPLQLEDPGIQLPLPTLQHWVLFLLFNQVRQQLSVAFSQGLVDVSVGCK